MRRPRRSSRSSGQDLAERPARARWCTTLQLVFGQGVAQGAGPLGRGSSAPVSRDGAAAGRAALGVRCVPGRTPAASTVTTTQATPRARSAASGRTHDGSSEAVMMTAVMPRRSRPTDAMSVSTSGVDAVGVDRGEELHDLQVLAAAAVGRQVARSARR